MKRGERGGGGNKKKRETVKEEQVYSYKLELNIRTHHHRA